MKITISKRRSELIWLGVFLFTTFTFLGQGEHSTGADEMAGTTKKTVDVTSIAMNFDAPEEVSSGWTTFKYYNQSPDVHFFVLEKLPAGKSIENTRAEVLPVFQSAMDLIITGKSEEGFAEFSKLPEWFFQVQFTGGPGLISPGNTAETTVFLEPGLYLLECYVKMPNGMFHSMMGMLKEITVTAAKNGYEAPESTEEISISAKDGIVFDGEVKEGPQVFRVKFKDQKPHEHFIGHDVHLVRLSEEADLEELQAWMNWSTPEGFTTPGPEGVEFLGGTQELPAGQESFFSADLESGNYALISEVPNASEKNLLKTFTVTTAD